MHRIRQRLTFANVVSVIALFVAVSGGTAVALNGSNTVQSDDLGPGAQVKAPDIANNAVVGVDVAANSITGSDIYEPSLDEVPTARLGGFGRSNGGESCNPESSTFNACAVVTLNLPKQARLLLVAQARAELEVQKNVVFGGGNCQIGTTAGPLLDTSTFVTVDEGPDENVSLVGVTGPFPPGQHSFGIDCNETAGGIRFEEAGISAVAISPG